MYLTQARGDATRLFVVEQPGRIRVIRHGRLVRRPFLDVTSEVGDGSEQGLLSVAFAPDYARSRRFYVDYVDRAGDSRIVEYRRSRTDPDRADPASARLVLHVDQPQRNHNGGLVTFGPDGLLYIGFGDGGGAGDRHGRTGNGQNLGVLLGKILRIDPRRQADGRGYGVPADNPFRTTPGARPEIYAYGLRNPWRFAFDRGTGALSVGDVGQYSVEEIDWAPRGAARGANFGWRIWEGNRRFSAGVAPGHRRPVLTYTHADGCAITGGITVRDPTLPTLVGRHLYADVCDARLRTAVLRSPVATDRRTTNLRVPQCVSFAQDNAGHPYAISRNGFVYRVVAG